MGELLKDWSLRDVTTISSLWDVVVAVALSFILCLAIGLIYKMTYKGPNYSPSFVYTIIMMGVVVAMIMIVIGNNIAAAFGLIGAFSIIRFRTAMRDPKDIAFIFWGMAAGISCGLGYYLTSVFFTAFLCVVVYYLVNIRYAIKDEKERLLRILVPENLYVDGMFDDIFAEHLEKVKLIAVETAGQGSLYQLDYQIINKSEIEDILIIDTIRTRNANLKVIIRVNEDGE